MGQARRKREAERQSEKFVPDVETNGKVVIGYVHPEHVKASFHDSLINLLIYDMSHDKVVVNGGGRVAQYSSANISNARNNIVRLFLDESKAEWLLMLDADMTFEPDLVERLLDAAHEGGVPIVGGLCFGQVDGELFPTLYALDLDLMRMRRFHEYPDSELFQVHATGAACLLIHRAVLQAMRASFPEPRPWFDEGVLGEPPWGKGEPGTGSAMGEDITFCLRAGVCGAPIHVHTGIRLGHDKHWILTAEQYEKQRADAALDRKATA